MLSIRASESYPLSASTASAFKPSNSDLACVISATSPPVSSPRTGLPRASTTTGILLVHPPRERPIACGPSLFGTSSVLMCTHHRTIDHQHFQISVATDNFADPLPYARLAPALEPRLCPLPLSQFFTQISPSSTRPH